MLTDEDLLTLYWREKKSIRELGTLLNGSPTEVRYLLQQATRRNPDLADRLSKAAPRRQGPYPKFALESKGDVLEAPPAEAAATCDLPNEILMRLYREPSVGVGTIARVYGLTMGQVQTRIADVMNGRETEAFVVPVERRATHGQKPDGDELAALYCAQNLSLEAIGRLYGLSKQAVSRWMQIHGIEARSTSYESPPVESLRHYYCEQELSMSAVAELFEVSEDTVRRWLRRAGIPLRRGSPLLPKPDTATLQALHIDQGLSAYRIAEMFGTSSSTVYHWLITAGIPNRRRMHQNPGPEVLTRLYIDEGKPMLEIGKLYGVSYPTARKWLNECKIPLKKAGTWVVRKNSQ